MLLKSMMLRVCILLFSLIGFTYANDCKFIDNDVKHFMDKNQIHGVAITIINDKDTTYCNYGYADKAKKRKITQKTIFEIASITKTFTASLAAIGEIEGQYSLKAPITEYLPNLTNPYYAQINSIELLSHTANIPFKLRSTATEHDLINSLNQVQYSSKPEIRYSYSNPGVAIVGLALQHAYKKSYQELLQTKILNKLGMKYTFIDMPKQYHSLLSAGFNEHNKQISVGKASALFATGGLKSNSEDMALYLKYQINGSDDDTLNQALKLVHKDYYCIDNQRYQQLAWEHFPDTDLNIIFNEKQTLIPGQVTTDCDFSDGVIEKTGTTYGMSSYMAYSLKNKTGIVILINKGLISDRVNLGKQILKKLN